MEHDTPRVALITGSTDGIGMQTAVQLARKGWCVVIHGRSEARCRERAAAVRTVTGSKMVDCIWADLGSLAQVRDMARLAYSRFGPIAALIDNAGLFAPKMELSEDGVEMTFAVNHLSHFLLTLLLLELSEWTAPLRIVVVSSMAHAATMDFDGLVHPRVYSGHQAYAQSKLANLLFAFHLADKLEGSGVTVNALHPGVVGTKLLRAGWGMGGISTEQGAKTSVYLAESPEVTGVTGRYFVDSHQAEPTPFARDRSAQERLWELSRSLCAEFLS